MDIPSGILLSVAALSPLMPSASAEALPSDSEILASGCRAAC